MGRPRTDLSVSTTTISSQTNTACDAPIFASDAASVLDFDYGLQDDGSAAQNDYDESNTFSSWLADDSTLVSSDAPEMLLDTSSPDLQTPVSDDIPDAKTTLSRKNHFHSISELNDDLLKQLHNLKLPDHSLSKPGQQTHQIPSSPSTDPTHDLFNLGYPTNSIGSILNSSQRLLDILHPLLLSSTSPTPSQITQTDHLHFNDQQASKSLLPLALSPKAFFPTQPTPPALNRSRSIAFSLPSLTNSTQPTSPNPSETILAPDFPIVMALLSAFTTLSRIYRLLFSRITTTLRHSSHASSALNNDPAKYGGRSAGTATLPRVNLDGFTIEQDVKLHVKVLLQVCTHMLERVERGVRGLLVESCGGDERLSSGLFEAVCRQEALEGEGGEGRSEGVNLRAKAGLIERLVEEK